MDIKEISKLDPANITQEQIESIKQAFGKVYRVSLCGHKYIIRPVYGIEYANSGLKDLKAQQKTNEFDEALTNMCLICPKPDPAKGGWSSLEAGIPSALSLLIQAKSGFIIPGGLEELPMTVENMVEDSEVIYPTEEESVDLKSRTSTKLYRLTIGDKCYVVRPLLRLEWRNMLSTAVDDRDVAIATKATMWPKAVSYDKELSGVADTIAQYVLTVSGFEPPTEVEEL